MSTYKLNFPNGNVQTYPDSTSMRDAARAMGGEAKSIKAIEKIYAFVTKK